MVVFQHSLLPGSGAEADPCLSRPLARIDSEKLRSSVLPFLDFQADSIRALAASVVLVGQFALGVEVE